mgnify:CR=1 FL=1
MAGANVELIDRGVSAEAVVDGGYGQGRFIRQALHDTPRFDDAHVIVGSWVVGDEPAGMSLRDIAINQNRSPKTISTQKIAAMRKLDVRSDQELISYCLEANLFQ